MLIAAACGKRCFRQRANKNSDAILSAPLSLFDKSQSDCFRLYADPHSRRENVIHIRSLKIHVRQHQSGRTTPPIGCCPARLRYEKLLLH
jgi:hypothetical protein